MFWFTVRQGLRKPWPDRDFFEIDVHRASGVIRFSNLCWWWFAWAWSRVWYLYAALKNKYGLGRPVLMGRHTDPTPTYCNVCGWTGPRRWACHLYKDDCVGDVEPADFCPRCWEEV